MDWNKIVTIATIWLVVGVCAFFIDWYTIIPATAALAGTLIIANS